MIDKNGKPHLYERHVDTDTIYRVLKTAEIGDVITYDAMSEALGRDVRKHCYQKMNTAREILLREGVYFDTHRNIGLKRMSDAEKVQSVAGDLKHRERHAKKSLKKLGSVVYEDLPKEVQPKLLAYSSQVQTELFFATAKATKAIEAKVANSGQPIAIGETMELFIK